MTTYILGAGPTGMGVVDGLIDANNRDFILIERGHQLGGLAQTVTWPEVGAHDLGPHKIFTLNVNLSKRVEALLPETDWLTRQKISSIFINGHYLSYPPSPFSLARVFGIYSFLGMVIGYGLARIKSIFRSRSPNTFEEDLSNRIGRPLYDVLFKPIALKLWGNPQKLDVKLSLGRVQTPSFLEVIGRILKLKKNSEFEALTFRYPKGGLSRIWTAIEAKSKSKDQFLLGHKVTRLEATKDRVTAIHFQSNGINGRIDIRPDDNIVSTLPLTLTTKLLSAALPQHLPKLAEKVITLNDLILVFLHIDQPSLLDESWVFVPDPNIVFHRLSEQESFDPSMTKSGSIVCCEIMSGPDRPIGEKTDLDLCADAINGLSKMGYMNYKVLGKYVIRLPQSYPVFQVDFEIGLKEIIQSLDQFVNFRSIGRQGAFNYIGTMDAMDIGYGYAEWLVRGGASIPWQQERERTNHYPVLD